jgi:hypothetical protein
MLDGVVLPPGHHRRGLRRRRVHRRRHPRRAAVPSQIGATRVGGVGLKRPGSAPRWPPCWRWPWPPAGSPSRPSPPRFTPRPGGPTPTTRPARARPRPAQTARQTAGPPKPACPGAYQVPDPAARTIAAPLSLRDEVICPILAGIRSPDVATHPPPGPASTATTKPCASTCRPCPTT